MCFGLEGEKEKKKSQYYLFKAEDTIIYFIHIRHQHNISRSTTQSSPVN